MLILYISQALILFYTLLSLFFNKLPLTCLTGNLLIGMPCSSLPFSLGVAIKCKRIFILMRILCIIHSHRHTQNSLALSVSVPVSGSVWVCVQLFNLQKSSILSLSRSLALFSCEHVCVCVCGKDMPIYCTHECIRVPAPYLDPSVCLSVCLPALGKVFVFIWLIVAAACLAEIT